jgi:hypothetical protein
MLQEVSHLPGWVLIALVAAAKTLARHLVERRFIQGPAGYGSKWPEIAPPLHPVLRLELLQHCRVKEELKARNSAVARQSHGLRYCSGTTRRHISTCRAGGVPEVVHNQI